MFCCEYMRGSETPSLAIPIAKILTQLVPLRPADVFVKVRCAKCSHYRLVAKCSPKAAAIIESISLKMACFLPLMRSVGLHIS